MKYIQDFRDKDRVSSYSLLHAQKVVEEDGKAPYLHLTLGDRTGDIEARVFLDIPEALIIHYVDDLDSKMNRFSRLLMEDRGQSDFTPFDRYLDRVVFKGSYESSEH